MSIYLPTYISIELSIYTYMDHIASYRVLGRDPGQPWTSPGRRLGNAIQYNIIFTIVIIIIINGYIIIIIVFIIIMIHIIYHIQVAWTAPVAHVLCF